MTRTATQDPSTQDPSTQEKSAGGSARVRPGAVSVVISGNRPWEVVAADSPRYAGVDGRLSDLDSKRAPSLMPLVSDHWGRNFRWRGDGEMPVAERTKLRSIAQKAHERGWRVRFWATPEKESLWRELRAAGVDHINTDQLAPSRAVSARIERGQRERDSRRVGSGDR